MPKTVDLDIIKIVSRKRRVLSATAKKNKQQQARKDASRRRRELRESRLSRGMCGRCGIDPIEKWRKFCAVCLDNAARMNRDSHKKRQEERRESVEGKTRGRVRSETKRLKGSR